MHSYLSIMELKNQTIKQSVHQLSVGESHKIEVPLRGSSMPNPETTDQIKEASKTQQLFPITKRERQ